MEAAVEAKILGGDRERGMTDAEEVVDEMWRCGLVGVVRVSEGGEGGIMGLLVEERVRIEFG